MKKRFLAMALAAMVTVSLVGCGGGEEPEPTPTPTPAPESTPTPEPTPTPYVPAGNNPLTGEPMEPEEAALRPVAVMLNNLYDAQPQLGNSLADIIYEVPAEGGITRMLCVYQSLEGVGTLGSIRSARPYYMELALGHDALYVHAGGSPEAYQDLFAWKMDNMDGVNGGSDAQIFWRDSERKKTMSYEHTLVTSGENILDYVQSHFRTTHGEGHTYTQTFVEDGTPAGGEAAEHVTLKYSNYKTGLFDYDADSDKYLVSQYGSPYVDGNTGQQVAVTNVLVLETAISVIPGDSAGRLSVKLTGGGEGTCFCGGKAAAIRWSKVDRNSPLVYTLPDGTPLALGKGSSYVCIVSSSSGKLSYE